MRHTWYTREINGNLFRLDFDKRFTQRAFDTGDALSGNALASFLLGAPSRRRRRQQLLPDVPLELLRAVDPGRLEDRQSPDAEPRPALGLQHAGVRGGRSPQLRVRHLHGERDDSRRWCSSGRPATSVRGGPTFVGVNGASEYPYKRDKNMIQPRVGFAYMLDDKTIMRGGYGIYYLNVVGISSSDGFGVQTPPVTSLDGDRNADLRAGQSVPERRAGGAGLVARPGDEPRTHARLLEPGLRESVRAPVLVRLPAHAAVAHDVRSLLRRLAHARAAEPVGRASTSRR